MHLRNIECCASSERVLYSAAKMRNRNNRKSLFVQRAHSVQRHGEDEERGLGDRNNLAGGQGPAGGGERYGGHGIQGAGLDRDRGADIRPGRGEEVRDKQEPATGNVEGGGGRVPEV